METLKITVMLLLLVLIVFYSASIIKITGTGNHYPSYEEATKNWVSGSYQMENRHSPEWRSEPMLKSTEALTNTLIGYPAGYETTTGNESDPWGSGSFTNTITAPNGRYWTPSKTTGDNNVGFSNAIPPHTTGDHNTCISQWDCEEILDYLESISGTPTWRHSSGANDVCKCPKCGFEFEQ